MTVVVRGGRVAEVVIDNPRRRNALSMPVLRALTEAIRDLSEQQQTRAIVVSGSNGVFSAGADLKEEASNAETFETVIALYEAINSSPKPILAKVEGHCIGLAVGVVATCDLAFCTDDTSFSLPEARLGQAPTLAALTIVPRLRPADASRLLLTGDAIDGTYASAIGLVNASARAADLGTVVQSWADKIIAGGPQAIAVCKQLSRITRTPLDSGVLTIVEQMLSSLSRSSEAAEGRAAFAERRQPLWVAEPPSGPTALN
jgi:methylglutaconyl-CoA hydratase